MITSTIVLSKVSATKRFIPRCYVIGKWILHIWKIDWCYVIGKWILHIWKTAQHQNLFLEKQLRFSGMGAPSG